jgi:hypothetical protein
MLDLKNKGTGRKLIKAIMKQTGKKLPWSKDNQYKQLKSQKNSKVKG